MTRPDPITRDEVEASPWRSTTDLQHFYTASGELAMTIDSRPLSDEEQARYAGMGGYLDV